MKGWWRRLSSNYKAIKQSARICKTLLFDQRYFASVKSGKFLDREGDYVPWFTFPAIEAIKNWDLSDKRVFEYGSGYSTLFWSSRAREVISVEHNPGWHDKISKLAPLNTRIILAPISQKADEYHPSTETCEQFRRYADSIKGVGVFDVVVVDGYAKSRVRYQCAQSALSQLATNGVVILDNSDWLPATAMYLRRAGLIEIDLSGMVPGNEYCQTTSFFFTRDFDFPSASQRQPLAPVGGKIDNWEVALERKLQGEQILKSRIN